MNEALPLLFIAIGIFNLFRAISIMNNKFSISGGPKNQHNISNKLKLLLAGMFFCSGIVMTAYGLHHFFPVV